MPQCFAAALCFLVLVVVGVAPSYAVRFMRSFYGRSFHAIGPCVLIVCVRVAQMKIFVKAIVRAPLGTIKRQRCFVHWALFGVCVGGAAIGTAR